MPTQCSADLFGFAPVEGRRVEAAFVGGAITSDAGLLAYRELDDTLRPTDTGADTLADARTGKWPDVPADGALYDALETGDYAKWHAYKTDQRRSTCPRSTT